MISKKFFFVAVSFVMAGCANTYIEPIPPVVIKAATSITFPLVTDNWEEGTVQLAIKDKKGCGEFSQDILPPSGNQDFNFGIEGNNDVFFHLTRSDSLNKCEYVGMFYATLGKEYILNIDMKDQTCHISLIELTLNGQQRKMNTYPAHTSQIDGVKVCENKKNLYK